MIGVNLTTTEENKDKQEVCTIEPPLRTSEISRKESKLLEQLGEDVLGNLSKLFNKNLLAKLILEDTWRDRLRGVIGRGGKQELELMGPYTNPLWNQMAVLDDCMLVDNRRAKPVQN